MEQANGPNKGTESLQHEHEKHLAHNNAPRNWLARNWRTAGGVGVLLAVASIGVYGLVWASSAIEDVGLALNFIAQNTLGLFVLLAVIVQLIISTKQWEAMTDGLKIERAKTDPRLRVVGVTAEKFQAGERPIYIVTIANDGLLPATDVRTHMSIEIDDQKPMDWIDDVVTTIPANGKEHYFIHSSMWLSQEQLESFDYDRASLRVVGFFEYAQSGSTPFCYKYLSMQGESRPARIPQFVRCDYTPRLNTTLVVQSAHHEHTAENVTLIQQRVKPNPDKRNKDGKDEDNQGKPN